MFTGIVEECGVVTSIKKKNNLSILKVRARKVLQGTRVGDSIAVNGVCLTATSITTTSVSFDVMRETLIKTTIGCLKPKDTVNLERAMRASDRIGGHFVSGHVDAVVSIKKVVLMENYRELQIQMPKLLAPFIVEKGSVCLDGVSLTVGKVKKASFSVYLIPHTEAVTTFKNKAELDKINVETDILAKYIVNANQVNA